MPSLHPSDYISKEFTSSGELEEVFTGQHSSSEEQPLLSNHPKYFTVVPRPHMLFGVYNKINYVAGCYKACLVANNEQGPKTSSLLLFGGGFSKIGSSMAFILMLVLAVVPFSAAWPFIVEEQTSINNYRELLIFTACMQFAFFLWHLYCSYVIKVKIFDVWLNSWFTFCVETKILLDENSVKTHSFFCLKGKLRVIDVSVSDLCRLNSGLHQLTGTERERLARVVEKHRLDQAVIILYSEKFISEFITRSMLEIFVLATLSAVSTVILVWKTLVTNV